MEYIVKVDKVGAATVADIVQPNCMLQGADLGVRHLIESKALDFAITNKLSFPVHVKVNIKATVDSYAEG